MSKEDPYNESFKSLKEIMQDETEDTKATQVQELI